MLGGMAHLTAGFRRFGEGDFRTDIPWSAVRARRSRPAGNQMGQSSAARSERGVESTGLKGDQSALSEQLRESWSPRSGGPGRLDALPLSRTAAGRSLSGHAGGVLRLLGARASTQESVPSFHLGEGPDRAGSAPDEITSVHAPADQLRVISALPQGPTIDRAGPG